MTTSDVLHGNDIQRLMQVVRGIQRFGVSYVNIRYMFVFLELFVQSDGFGFDDTNALRSLSESSLLLFKVGMNLHATAVLHSVSTCPINHLVATLDLRDRSLRVSQVAPSQYRNEPCDLHPPHSHQQRVASSLESHAVYSGSKAITRSHSPRSCFFVASACSSSSAAPAPSVRSLAGNNVEATTVIVLASLLFPASIAFPLLSG